MLRHCCHSFLRMSIQRCLIFVLFGVLSHHQILVHCCGCYGSRTCTPKGERCDPSLNDSCSCDCCPPCNRCEQFFPTACFKDRFRHLSDHPLTFQFRLNRTIRSDDIADRSNGTFVHYLWDPCLSRPLPEGIDLVESSKLGIYQLVGRPRKVQEAIDYELVFKGLVSQLFWVNLTISIVDNQHQTETISLT